MHERFPNAALSLSPDRRSLVVSLAGFEVGDIELLTNLDQFASRE